MKLKDAYSLEENLCNLDSIFKSRDITLLTKVCLVKAMVFPVVMYGCESWTVKKAVKNWCFWTMVLEKTLESPLDCKEIQPVHSEGDQSWDFFGRNDATVATSWEELTHWKRLWCWERLKAGGEGDNREWDIEWHHRLYAHEFESTPGVGDEQGSLACRSYLKCVDSHLPVL